MLNVAPYLSEVMSSRVVSLSIADALVDTVLQNMDEEQGRLIPHGFHTSLETLFEPPKRTSTKEGDLFSAAKLFRRRVVRVMLRFGQKKSFEYFQPSDDDLRSTKKPKEKEQPARD